MNGVWWRELSQRWLWFTCSVQQQMLAAPSPLWRNTAEKTPPGGEMEGILTVWRKKIGSLDTKWISAGMNLDCTFRQSEAIFYIKHFCSFHLSPKTCILSNRIFLVIQKMFVHIFFTFILMTTEALIWKSFWIQASSNDSFLKKPAAIFHHHHLHQILWFSLDWVYNCFTLMTVRSALNEASNRINWCNGGVVTPLSLMQHSQWRMRKS